MSNILDKIKSLIGIKPVVIVRVNVVVEGNIYVVGDGDMTDAGNNRGAEAAPGCGE